MKASTVLHPLMVALSVYHTLSADWCDDKSSVRCGDECTVGFGGNCTCGEDSKKFSNLDNTSWCCNATDCEKNGTACKKATLLPLTTHCQGKFNPGKSYFAARECWGCDSKDQCIKIQYVQDEVQHCHDRSDERKINQDLYSHIQWDKITTCYRKGNPYYPGVKCSGQGVANDCL